MLSRSFLVTAVSLAASAQLLFAQHTISLYSGSIQYTSGAVTVADQPVEKSTTNVLSLKNGEAIATGADGAAEVLLTPGVFVRLVGNSSFRLDSNSLADTRVTVLTGSVMVECVELMKGDNVTFFVSTVAGAPTVEIRKPGLFRIDAQPPKVSVLQGQVFASGVTVSKDRVLALGQPVLHADKFKLDKQDDLFMFSEARSADSAYASNVASHSLYNSGGTCMASSWYWMNPVGMYAYLPCNGFNNFFGYPFVGVNYGYLYDGIPYYYPPPVLVCRPHNGHDNDHDGDGHKGNDHDADDVSRTAGKSLVASSGKTASSLMKVPAFTSVLSTKPTYMSVSRASYTAHIADPTPQSFQIGNLHLAGQPTVATNRYMAATSLSTSHSSAASGSGGGFRAAQAFGGGTSYSGGGGGTHFSGGGSTSSVSHSSGSYSGGGGSSYSGGSGGGHVSAASSSVSTSSAGAGHK